MHDRTTGPEAIQPVPSVPNPACLAAALDYLARGLSPVPLCPPDHSGDLPPRHLDECNRPGKRPPRRWEHLQKRRATEAELRAAWTKNQRLNVGIVTGHISGLVGIDIDGPEGEELLRELSRGELPRTWEFTTPGGGRRLLYRWPKDMPMRSTSFPTKRKPLHALGEGALTVMPPSAHASGGVYAWTENGHPDRAPLADAPLWLQALLHPQPKRKRLPGGGGNYPSLRLTATASAERRARAYLRKCDPAVQGQGGSNQTFKVACKLIHGFELPADLALALLLQEYNPRCRPPWSEKELLHKVTSAAAVGSSPPMADRPAPGPRPRTSASAPRSSSSSPAESVDDGIAGVTAAELRTSPANWLFPARLEMGTLAVIEGKKGLGKSSLLAAIAADVTGGPRLPPTGQDPRFLGKVLWFGSEDHAGDVTGARLRVAGAVMQHVRFPGVNGEGRVFWRPSLPGDLDKLEQLIDRDRAKLLILDPYVSFVAAGVNVNAEQQVRGVLEPLGDLAARTGCLCIITRHLAKTKGREAIDQGLGSVGVGNLARSVLRVERYQDEADRFVFFVVANNRTKRPPSLLYRIDDVEGMSKVRWDGQVDADAEELAGNSDDAGERGTRADARKLLRLRLADGPSQCADIFREGEQAGISMRTMQRARDELKIVVTPRMIAGKRVWFWEAPPGGFPPEK